MTDEILTASEMRLAQARNMGERLDALNALAWELRYSDPQRGYALAEEARQLAGDPANTRYPAALAAALRNLGHFLQQKSEYHQALGFLLQAQALAEGLPEILALRVTLFLTMGAIYERLGEYPAAVEQFIHTVHLCEHTGDTLMRANALNGLGVVYNNLGESDRALAALREALALYEEHHSPQDQAKALNNMILAYSHQQNYEQAMACGARSLTLTHAVGARVIEAHVYNNLGAVYLALGDHATALAHFEQARAISSEIGYFYTQIYALRRIGEAYRLEQPERAVAHLQQAIAMAEAVTAKSELFECHRLLAEIYEQQGELERALYHYQQFSSVKEQVFNDSTNQKLKTLQVMYETESARKEAEIVQLKNIALEQEIVERRRVEAALRHYTHELEVSNAELDAFAHTVAHDLKTPLTALIGFSTLLQTRYARMGTAALEEALEVITRSGHRLKNIVEELLLLASVRKVEDIQRTPLDMAAIVGEARARLADVIDERKAAVIVCDSWPAVLGYAPWVEEVWVNYLSNAIKYGGELPRVELGYTAPVTSGLETPGVKFWVQDNGHGLTSEECGRLFVEFTRLEQARAEGHGLGLSIVRRIVEKLGGAVGVESVVEQGSVFWFTLPAVGPDAAAP